MNETPSDEILRALLEQDDEDLVKGVAHPTTQEHDAQLAKILPELIRRKEDYLEKPCYKTSIGTNPHNQTFLYGFFGSKRNHTVSSLAYFDPEQGWIGDNWVDLPENEGGEFKDVFHGEPMGNKWLRVGTVVHGTLQEEDLIPAFLDAIRSINPVEAAELELNYPEEIASGDPEFCWETLLDKVNKYSPPFTYFGAHPGNSSDFGIWPNEENITEAAEQKPEELAIIDEGQPLSRGSKYIAIRRADGAFIALLDGNTGEEIWRYD